VRTLRSRLASRLARIPIIGAGSVVTRDIPANSIAVGNPAHVIREIPERDPAFADVEGVV